MKVWSKEMVPSYLVFYQMSPRSPPPSPNFPGVLFLSRHKRGVAGLVLTAMELPRQGLGRKDLQLPMGHLGRCTFLRGAFLRGKWYIYPVNMICHKNADMQPFFCEKKTYPEIILNSNDPSFEASVFFDAASVFSEHVLPSSPHRRLPLLRMLCRMCISIYLHHITPSCMFILHLYLRCTGYMYIYIYCTYCKHKYSASIQRVQFLDMTYI